MERRFDKMNYNLSAVTIANHKKSVVLPLFMIYYSKLAKLATGFYFNVEIILYEICGVGTFFFFISHLFCKSHKRILLPFFICEVYRKYYL